MAELKDLKEDDLIPTGWAKHQGPRAGVKEAPTDETPSPTPAEVEATLGKKPEAETNPGVETKQIEANPAPGAYQTRQARAAKTEE